MLKWESALISRFGEKVESVPQKIQIPKIRAGFYEFQLGSTSTDPAAIFFPVGIFALISHFRGP